MGKVIVIKGVDFSSVKLTTILLNKEMVSLSAVYTQTKVVRPNTPLDSLKDDLTVTAAFDDGTSAEIISYTLSGTFSVGTSTIIVSVENVSTSFNVTVSDYKHSYSFANGDLIEEMAASVWYAASNFSPVGYAGLEPNQKRRSLVLNEGVHIPLYSVLNTHEITGVYSPESYLIPIPTDATSVSVSITPSQRYIGIGLYTYNPDTHEFIRVVDSGWQQGSWSSNVFTAGAY